MPSERYNPPAEFEYKLRLFQLKVMTSEVEKKVHAHQGWFRMFYIRCQFTGNYSYQVSSTFFKINNLVYGLPHQESLVAQWLERPINNWYLGGHGFDSCQQDSEFFFVPRSLTLFSSLSSAICSCYTYPLSQWLNERYNVFLANTLQYSGSSILRTKA